MFRTLSVIICLLINTAPLASAQDQAVPYTIGHQTVVHSEILNEDRRIWVSLPYGYETRSAYHRYPVLYVLDGERHFAQIVGVVRSLSSDATPLAPEMIVIGIASQNRIKDSTPTQSIIGADGLEDTGWMSSGGAEAFNEFLAEELIPFVDDQYATSDFRILSGYSLTGLAAVNNLLTRPEMFDAHIAADPSIWWDGFSILQTASTAIEDGRFEHNHIFLTTTAQTYPAPYITVEAGGAQLVDLLERTRPDGLTIDHHHFLRETHHSLPMLSLYEGLASIFEGHMITLDELYDQPETIPARFAALSERLNYQVSPPEGLMNYFASVFENGNYQDLDKALVYAQINVQAYPGSASAWSTIARLHEARGEAHLSEQALARASHINSERE